MINNYEIIEYPGLDFVEVIGESFHYLDLYELVGQHQYMTTFIFKLGSEAYSRYGESVGGIIYYDFKNLEQLKRQPQDLSTINPDTIRIDSPEIEKDIKDRTDLKYGGIKIADLEFICFLKYKHQSENYATGEKKVPNIIEIEFDFSDIDPDILMQNYLIKKYNDQVDLAPFEKEKFVGLITGMGKGRIDKRILQHLGFNEETVWNNFNILSQYYKVLERKGTLSEEQKEKYSDIKAMQQIEILKMIFEEINASGAKAEELGPENKELKEIISSALSFESSVLMHGKKQIYWDLSSYLHIAMRHLKEFQLGKFKEKSSFPYKAKDLENLIEQVLKCVEDEYKAEVLDKPDKPFVRVGSMAVEFNGEHYNLRIDPSGRLTQFHSRG